MTHEARLRLATWNVNSLKVRLPHLLEWLQRTQPDIICLQELKLETASFPHAALEDIGYQALVNGQKTYNGVAILYRETLDVPHNIHYEFPDWVDPQRRILCASFGDLTVASWYVPNGQSLDSEKYVYKLAWLKAATAWLQEMLGQSRRLAILGDFNIAPEDRDVCNPSAWEGQVLVSKAERQSFQEWLKLGLYDCFRLFPQPEKIFSWWDYRQLAFPKNQGLRIDHILVNTALQRQCQACSIDKALRKLSQPSDHAPVVADFQETSCLAPLLDEK